MSLLTPIISTLGHALPGTRANRLLILIYHRVQGLPDPMFPGEIDAASFDWQMALLRQHCRPMSLAEGVEGLKRGKLPTRAVAVSFDDGYADNATIALPILQRHQITATFFISPGFLNGGRMWNDSVIEAIRRAPGSDLDLADLGLGRVALGPESSRGPVAESVIEAIKHLHPSERAERVSILSERVGTQLPDDLMMTNAQVRSLAGAGMEIGAHTMSHPILRALSDVEAREEIDRSRLVLEAIVGQQVGAFAYPNGQPCVDYTERDRNLVESLGFKYAACTKRSTASATSDMFQLPRFTPWDRTPDRWLLRLLMGFGFTW